MNQRPDIYYMIKYCTLIKHIIISYHPCLYPYSVMFFWCVCIYVCVFPSRSRAPRLRSPFRLGLCSTWWRRGRSTRRKDWSSTSTTTNSMRTNRSNPELPSLLSRSHCVCVRALLFHCCFQHTLKSYTRRNSLKKKFCRLTKLLLQLPQCILGRNLLLKSTLVSIHSLI